MSDLDPGDAGRVGSSPTARIKFGTRSLYWIGSFIFLPKYIQVRS